MNQQPLGENPLARRRDNVFRRTEEVRTARSGTMRKLPAQAETQAVENRIQFVLSPRHLRLLDDLCYHTRRATGYKLNRSEVVRVVIEQLEHKTVDHSADSVRR